MFCFQIFTLKLNLRPKKVWPMQFLSKSDFLEFLSQKILFYFSLLNLNYWYFTTNCETFSKKIELVENLSPSYLPDFCIICIPFYYQKKWIFIFSSPEPSVSPSTIFKQHLLLNHWLDFDQTSEEWSLVGPLSKLSKWFWYNAYLGHRS